MLGDEVAQALALQQRGVARGDHDGADRGVLERLDRHAYGVAGPVLGLLDGEHHLGQQPLHVGTDLLALVADVPCKFNLIPWNPFPGSALARSDAARVQAFAQRLADAGIVTTVRRTRGDDIDAACGQLAGDIQDRTRLAERAERAERTERVLARRIPIVPVAA